ncbi:STAS-like domain-containing protein [Mongoliitalea lutea]|uniref:DUF4325 domain-containing protein n=1 Tax=Mongoliitalea lutea TaxID=849756 RepID=A0A8J3G703_9BACT|nr:STAS-like domain-containing protein [Mongoliitalea lutea]GHB48408.1 hypothetical protein GCM10008106_31520 [Mongoliitalea lutea]
MGIRVTHIVKKTYKNKAGNEIYLRLKEELKNSESLKIYFKDGSVPSSSFLNSSFGALIEEIGLPEFLCLVNPIELTPTQAYMLKHYIQWFKPDYTKH